MTVPYDRSRGIITIPTQIVGPTAERRVELALDTAATTTIVDIMILQAIGFELSMADEWVAIGTASELGAAPLFVVREVEAFGITKANLAIVGHQLPEGLEVDGMLGLNFFDNERLTIDFKQNTVELE